MDNDSASRRASEEIYGIADAEKSLRRCEVVLEDRRPDVEAAIWSGKSTDALRTGFDELAQLLASLFDRPEDVTLVFPVDLLDKSATVASYRLPARLARRAPHGGLHRHSMANNIESSLWPWSYVLLVQMPRCGATLVQSKSLGLDCFPQDAPVP